MQRRSNKYISTCIVWRWMRLDLADAWSKPEMSLEMADYEWMIE